MHNTTEPVAASSLPDIDCVVIGVNTEATLARCLNSIIESDYPADKLHLIYVDGGSYDKSIEIAGQFHGVEIISLGDNHPTPGRGRNNGWNKGDSPLVQFLDSDTILEKDWFSQGIQAIDGNNVGAVQGYRKEISPQKSIFNWLTSLEWNGPPGEAESFGGDVLIRRNILEETGGYDEIMVGGEDPELSQRIKDRGWRILQLDTIMTHHDIAMFSLTQYWKRAFRSGYGFAAVIDKGAGRERGFWMTEFRRIIVRGGCSLGLLSLAICLLLMTFSLGSPALMLSTIAITLALLLLFWPRLFRVGYFKDSMNLSKKQAKTYAWHCSLVVIPDLIGVIRYYLGKITGKPLRNNPGKLKTRVSAD